MECKAERDNGLFLSLHHHDVVLARAVECPSGIVSVISVSVGKDDKFVSQGHNNTTRGNQVSASSLTVSHCTTQRRF